MIEFQHSPISIEEIDERNKFYNAAGYSVAWVFDVQEQFDVESIYFPDDRDIYRWKHPKKSLKCFPQPKEESKNLIVYLYWCNEDGDEFFNRVIWSSNEDNCPDFKRFIVSPFDPADEPYGLLEVENFFKTKKDLLKEHLAKLKCFYRIKRKGEKGFRKDDYICPRTNKFGVSIYGETGCSYCKYCAAIENAYRGVQRIYCCFPNQVREVFEVHPGFECSGVERF